MFGLNKIIRHRIQKVIRKNFNFEWFNNQRGKKEWNFRTWEIRDEKRILALEIICHIAWAENNHS